MWFYPKKIHPAWVSAETKKVVENPVLARSHRKIKKIPVKMKIYNFKNFIFEFSKFFWYDCFFDLWKNVGKHWRSSQNKFFCQLMFVSSIVCWWMSLDCFTCISVIFQAINLVCWALENLDFGDSENVWLSSKNIDLAWGWTKR